VIVLTIFGLLAAQIVSVCLLLSVSYLRMRKERHGRDHR
jgi:hypothetical protein